MKNINIRQTRGLILALLLSLMCSICSWGQSLHSRGTVTAEPSYNGTYSAKVELYVSDTRNRSFDVSSVEYWRESWIPDGGIGWDCWGNGGRYVGNYYESNHDLFLDLGESVRLNDYTYSLEVSGTIDSDTHALVVHVIIPGNPMTGSKNYAGSITVPSGYQTPGSTVTITQTAKSYIVGGSISWQRRPSGSSSWTPVSGSGENLTVTVDGDYIYRRVLSGNGKTAYSNEVNILTQPLTGGSIYPSSQSIYSGNNASTLTLSGASSGSGISYQWQVSYNNSTWYNILNATGTTYDPGSPSSSGYYRVVVNKSSQSTTSSTATINISPPPFNPGSVSSSQTIISNNNPSGLTLSGYSSGSNSFQWQQKIGTGSWTNISGATSTSYQPPVLTQAAIYYYRVYVSGSGQSDYSSQCSITVIDELIPGSVSPSQNIIAGDAVSVMTLSGVSGGSNSSYSYQWQQAGTDNVWTNISGATSLTYKPTTLYLTSKFRVLVSNGSGSSLQYKTSSECQITVYPAISAGVIHYNQTVYPDNRPTELTGTTPSGGTGSFTYQWQLKAQGDYSWNDIIGATGLSYQPPILFVTTSYRRNVTNLNKTISSNEVVITIKNYNTNITLQDWWIDQDAPYNGGAVTGNYEVSSSQFNDPISIEHMVDSLFYNNHVLRLYPVATPTGDIYGTLRLTFPRNLYPERKQYYVYLGSTSIAVWHNCIEGGLWVFDCSGGGEITEGSSSSITLSNSQLGGVVYELVNQNDQVVMTLNGTGSKLTFNGINTAGQYRVRAVYNNTKLFMNNTINISKALNAGQAQPSQSLTLGQSPTTLYLTGVSGGNGSYSYLWQWKSDSNNWTDIYNATSATYYPMSLGVGTYSYRAKVSSNGQEQYSEECTIAVSPAIQVGTIEGEQTITAGQIPTIFNGTAASGGNGTFLYQWQMKLVNTSEWQNISGATSISYQSTALQVTTSFRRNVICMGQTLSSNEITVRVASQNEIAMSDSENYILTYKMNQPLSSILAIDKSNSMPTITYYDGLGRPKQQVEIGASPLGKDMITPIVYDPAGRDDAKSYLPYAISTSTGEYQSDPLSQQSEFYTNTFSADDAAYAYIEKVYEQSPMNRVLKQYNTGAAFRANDKKTNFAYLTNNANEVFRMSVNSSDGLEVIGYYDNYQLFKNASTNEDGLTTTVFTDKLNRKILERASDNTTTTDTYFVYDDLSRLRWVISPEGSKILTSQTYAENSDILKKYAYKYRYDGRGRIIEKRIPGAEAIFMAYDNNDRPVARETTIKASCRIMMKLECK